MKTFLTVILLSFLLAGCAGPPRWVWTHHERSDEQMRDDLELCRRHAAQGMPGMPLMTPQTGADFYEDKEDLIRDCMEAKGYYYEEVKRPRD